MASTMSAQPERGPDTYWKSPKFVRRYTVNAINLIRENPAANLFNITCMMGILQGINYLCPQPTSILDVGCGHGTRALDIKAKLNCRVVGLDYSDPMIEESSRIMAMLPEPRRVEIVKGDVMALEYNDGEFDVVTHYGLLMSVKDGEKAAAEMLRVAKYGVVGIEESEDAMTDEQRPELDKIRMQKYPGRIYWHNYNRLFGLAGAATVIFVPIPVPADWNMGTRPAYARYIAVKETA